MGKDAVDVFESGLNAEIEFMKVHFVLVFGHNLEYSSLIVLYRFLKP